jgi:glutamate dehydrogenase (NADP+)
MPSTNEAINYFLENGVCFAPAKAANCGGVMVSGFEMSQNAMHINWTFEEVDSKLKTQMEKIFTQMQEIAIEYKKPNNMPLAANILGFDRVAKAMIAQGIV